MKYIAYSRVTALLITIQPNALIAVWIHIHLQREKKSKLSCVLIRMMFFKFKWNYRGRLMHTCFFKLGQNWSFGSSLMPPIRRLKLVACSAWNPYSYFNQYESLGGPLGTNFNEIAIKTTQFLFTTINLTMASAKWRRFCLDLNVLIPLDHVCFVCVWGIMFCIAHWLFKSCAWPYTHLTAGC